MRIIIALIMMCSVGFCEDVKQYKCWECPESYITVNQLCEHFQVVHNLCEIDICDSGDDKWYEKEYHDKGQDEN
jgi:hypothetical protein